MVIGSSPVGGGYNKLFVGRVSLYNIMYNWEFGRVVKALVLRSNDILVAWVRSPQLPFNIHNIIHRNAFNILFIFKSLYSAAASA